MLGFSKNKKRKKIGLALGSGGFRGAAHISVIKALVENDIPIDFIAGSSIGALVGAHYAIFKDVEKIGADIFSQQDKKYQYLKDISLKDGILSGNAFEKAFLSIFKGAEFKNTQIPLNVVATDLISGEPFVFKNGDIARAVRASISIPLTFKPLKHEDKILIDGGISRAVPDDIVKKMGADIVISVNLYNKYDMNTNGLNISKILMRVIEIALQNAAISNMKSSDIIINPDTSKYSEMSRLKTYLDKKISMEIMKETDKEMKKIIPQIKKLIN
jgi:NTE family protein